MKKYLINDDDTVRIGQTIYKIDRKKTGSTFLIPLYEIESTHSKEKNPTVVNLPNPRPSVKEEHEYDKRDKQMSRNISNLKKLVECGENQSCSVIDGVSYGTSHTWYEVAQIALSLAEQQEWFDRYEDKY